jgi:CubicO group peptidase (beta-lactamase class C family)
MASAARSLPSRPSLRHLKLEAKRRLSAGEFSALYEAQLAIAREHGQPSWTALKKLIDGWSRQESHVLPQLRWVASRFRDAGTPGWVAPGVSELRQHFSEEFLGRTPPGQLIATITAMAADLREAYVVTAQAPLAAQVKLADLQIVAAVEADPSHRVTRMGRFPLGRRIASARGAAPATRTFGQVPEAAGKIAAAALAELGLPGLVLAGGGPDASQWSAARGWANLDRAEVLSASHRFPACRLTRLITATAVLRLVADGRVGLDDPANDHLRTFGLADDSVTVRELLTHTGGVDSPFRSPFAERVPDLATLVGPVLSCGGARGVFRVTDGGYAALGQMVADTTRSLYADAAARLVLEPLGMSDSSFPGSWPGAGPDAVTGYQVSRDMAFAPAPAVVCAIPAAGGLWTTAADLVRFGVMWSSLLPEALAREALRPQAARGPGGLHTGLGWLIGEHGDIAGISGGCPGAFASLLVRVPAQRGGNVTRVALTNRRLPILDVNVRVFRTCAAHAERARPTTVRWRPAAGRSDPGGPDGESGRCRPRPRSSSGGWQR